MVNTQAGKVKNHSNGVGIKDNISIDLVQRFSYNYSNKKSLDGLSGLTGNVEDFLSHYKIEVSKKGFLGRSPGLFYWKPSEHDLGICPTKGYRISVVSEIEKSKDEEKKQFFMKEHSEEKGHIIFRNENRSFILYKNYVSKSE